VVYPQEPDSRLLEANLKQLEKPRAGEGVFKQALHLEDANNFEIVKKVELMQEQLKKKNNKKMESDFDYNLKQMIDV
jgi:hypothetical protein